MRRAHCDSVGYVYVRAAFESCETKPLSVPALPRFTRNAHRFYEAVKKTRKLFLGDGERAGVTNFVTPRISFR